MSHVYDAIATLAISFGCVVCLLLAWRAFAIIAWIERRIGIRRPSDTGPRDYRTTQLVDPEAEAAAAEAGYVEIKDYVRQREGHRG